MRSVVSFFLLVWFLFMASVCVADSMGESIRAADYPSLQAAIDALPAEGGEVVLPAGRFELSEPLLVTIGDVHLRGAGTATHLHNINTDGEPAIALRPEEPIERPALKSKDRRYRWRIRLSNLRITGNEASGPGIDALWVNELFLDGITVSENGGAGIYMEHCLENARVSDCQITYNRGAGIDILGNHDTVISANQLEENQDAVRFIDGFNLTCTGNNIDDHLRHGVVVENSMGNTISANMIEQCQGIGIVLEGDTYATTIGSNIFTNNRKGGVSMHDAHSSTIAGNTFSIVPMRAVYVDEKSRALTISGNTFANRAVGEGEIKGRAEMNVASGIVLESASVLSITGNTFSRLDTPAVMMMGRPARRVVFQGNLLVNTAGGFEGLEESLVEGNLEVVEEE
ncbi:MAG: right-handed parallel beta-helix repeat-containing protein [Verrucomicrobiota bacterium]